MIRWVTYSCWISAISVARENKKRLNGDRSTMATINIANSHCLAFFVVVVRSRTYQTQKWLVKVVAGWKCKFSSWIIFRFRPHGNNMQFYAHKRRVTADLAVYMEMNVPKRTGADREKGNWTKEDKPCKATITPTKPPWQLPPNRYCINLLWCCTN